MRVEKFDIGGSRDGWTLKLWDTPRWAWAVESGYSLLMGALGHPCCLADRNGRSKWMGVIYDLLGHSEEPNWAQDRLEVFAYMLLSNRLTNCMWKHHHVLLEVPLTAEQAASVYPDFVAEYDDLIQPDESRVSTFTSGPTCTLSYSPPVVVVVMADPDLDGAANDH